MGELMIDFAEYGWFPEMLPSEEADERESHSSAEEEEAL
jgi:methylated-DNA-protein-cysteine methyltransferase related protein